jgi:polyamine oxidase
MVTTTYKESEKVEIKTDQQVKEEIHRVLQQMFPHIQVPYPTDILIPRWRQNPLFHGSYSNWPIGMSLQHHENMRAPLPLHPTQHPRLWFAGEAMSQKYYGYLHGAWLNGQEVGRIVGNCLTQSKCHHPYLYHPIVTGCSNAAQAKTLRKSMTRRFPPKAPEESANQKQKAFAPY